MKDYKSRLPFLIFPNVVLHFAESSVFICFVYESKGLTSSEGLNSPAGTGLNHFNQIFTKPRAAAKRVSVSLLEYIFSIGSGGFTHSPV